MSDFAAGWSSLVARRAHNPKVGGSNPPPATNTKALVRRTFLGWGFLISEAEVGALSNVSQTHQSGRGGPDAKERSSRWRRTSTTRCTWTG